MKKSTSKHIAQRTCVACCRVKPQQQLIRLVCNPKDGIEVDTSGKMIGRGAYLCRARECWELGLIGDRLKHALRSTFDMENRKQLVKYGEELEKKSASDQ